MRLPIRRTLSKQQLLPLAIVVLAVIASAYILLIDRRAASPPPANVVVVCDGEKAGDFACWSDRYKAITTNVSAEEAFIDLRRAYADSTYVQSQCHQITHVIGRTAATINPTIAEAYKKGDSFCSSGYYHGVVEQVATSMGKQEFVAQLNTICADLEAEKRFSLGHYNCVHGLGHGVMTISGNELYTSLKNCDTITDNWNRESCYGGVFMENVISDPRTNPSHTTEYLREDEPMYPCTAVDDVYKNQCYMLQSSYALRLVGYDFGQVFDLCANIESLHQDTCYQSLGRDASGNSISDVSTTKNTCELGGSERQRTNCAVGAVKDFIYYYTDDTKALELCAAFSDKPVQSTCRDTARVYYENF